MQCKSCLYWRSIPKERWAQNSGYELGECHFNAPFPAWNQRKNSRDIIDAMASWPLTMFCDFCSTYKDRVQQKQNLLQKIFHKEPAHK
jgi:hypothetical protein